MIIDDLNGKTLVLKYTRQSEWRTPISGPGGVGEAVRRAVSESGLAFDLTVDPTSIRFEVEP